MERKIYCRLYLLLSFFVLVPGILQAQIKVIQDPPPRRPQAPAQTTQTSKAPVTPAPVQGLTPAQLNEKIAAITDSLGIISQEWNLQFSEAAKSRDFSKLATMRKALERFIDEKITELKTMKDVGDSRAFRGEALRYLHFEKNVVSKAIRPMDELGKNPPEAQRLSALENLNYYKQEERLALEKVQLAQEAYMRSNMNAAEKTSSK